MNSKANRLWGRGPPVYCNLLSSCDRTSEQKSRCRVVRFAIQPDRLTGSSPVTESSFCAKWLMVSCPNGPLIGASRNMHPASPNPRSSGGMVRVLLTHHPTTPPLLSRSLPFAPTFVLQHYLLSLYSLHCVRSPTRISILCIVHDHEPHFRIEDARPETEGSTICPSYYTYDARRNQASRR
jgi:hypothetical protein